MEERCAETAEIGGSKPSSSANEFKGMAESGLRRVCRKHEIGGSNPSPLTKRRLLPAWS